MLKAEMSELKNESSSPNLPNKPVDETDIPSPVFEELSFENPNSLVMSASSYTNLGSPTNPKSPVKTQLIAKMKQIVKESSEAKEALSIKEKEVDELTHNISNLTEKLKNLEANQKNVDKNLVLRLQNESKEAQKKTDEKDLEIRVLKTSQQEKNKRIENLNKELRNANFENQDLVRKIRETELKGVSLEEFENLKRINKKLHNEMNSKESKTSDQTDKDGLHNEEKKQLKNELESLRNELSRASSTNSKLSHEIDQLKRKQHIAESYEDFANNLKIEITKLGNEISEKNQQLVETDSKLRTKSRDLQNLRKEADSMADNIQAMEKEIGAKDEEIEKLKDKLQDSELKKEPSNWGLINDLQNQIKNLEDQSQRDSGSDYLLQEEINNLKQQVEALTVEKEDLLFTLSGMQQQIRSGVFNQKTFVQEDSVSHSTVEESYSAPPKTSSDSPEQASVDMIKNLETQLNSLEKKNATLVEELEKAKHKLDQIHLVALLDLYHKFGGDGTLVQDKTFDEVLNLLQNLILAKLKKKDDVLRELNEENENFAERVKKMQKQASWLSSHKSLISDSTRLLEETVEKLNFTNIKVEQLTLFELVQQFCGLVVQEIEDFRADWSKSFAEIEELTRELENKRSDLAKSWENEEIFRRENEDLRIKLENVGQNSPTNVFEVETQHAKATIKSLLELRNVEFDEERDLGGLISQLYDHLNLQLEEHKGFLTEELSRNQMLVRRIEDSEAFLDDANNCRNILRQILSKNDLIYSNSSSLEELVLKVKNLTERLKSPVPVQPEKRSRSLTKILKNTNLMRKSKSSQNLKGSQISIASSYMSGLDEMTSSGFLSDFSNVSKMSTQQLKASLESMHETEPQEVDEIKVNLFEILKAMKKAPEYPKPSLQMVKMIRTEVEGWDNKTLERPKGEKNESETIKQAEHDLYIKELNEEHDTIHSNLYMLLNEAGLDPDPSMGTRQMSESAKQTIQQTISRLRNAGTTLERQIEVLEVKNFDLTKQVEELAAELELKVQQEEIVNAHKRSFADLQEVPDSLNVYQNVGTILADQKFHEEFFQEKEKLLEEINNLNHTNETETAALLERIDTLVSEKDELLKALKDKQSLLESQRFDLKKENEKCLALKAENLALVSDLNKLKEELVSKPLNKSNDFTDSSGEKISLKDRIKVLEAENQKLNSTKIQKESELQEKILSLIEQNTKLIEDKKQLRSEIKSLKQQNKAADGSNVNAMEQKWLHKIQSLEDELQTLKEQHDEGGLTAALEHELEQQRIKIDGLENQLRIKSEIADRNSLSANASGMTNVASLERNLMTANAKIMGQNEMIKRLQIQTGEVTKLKTNLQQLEIENDILISKLKENEAEDLTSIRFSFSRLCEDLDIKAPPEEQTLAEQMELAFEIIKKRYKGTFSKKVRFNPNLTSVQELDEKSKGKSKSATYPKSEEGMKDKSILAGSREELTVTASTDLVNHLESELASKELELVSLQNKLKSLEDSKVAARTAQSEDALRVTVVQILGLVESPQDFRLKSNNGLDIIGLLTRLRDSVQDFIDQKDCEVRRLSDVNRSLASRCKQLERDAQHAPSERERSSTSSSSFNQSRSVSDLSYY